MKFRIINNFLYLCTNNQTMVENIETIRENFQFESTEQYSAFDQISQEFLIRELMKEIVIVDVLHL